MTRRELLRAALRATGAIVAVTIGRPSAAFAAMPAPVPELRSPASQAVVGASDGEFGLDEFGPDVYRATLPNGLRVVVRERPANEVVALSVGVRGGSRDEEAETVGAAHFMEHMYFQGTPRRPDSTDVDREIEALGGWTNAWTGWESINFQAVAPRDGFDVALDIIADQMSNSLFAEDKIDKERQVVLEELNGRLNSPSQRAYDLFWPAVFGEHPARNLPIGSRATINQSTRDVLVRFRDRHFVAENMVLAVVGDVDHAAILPRIEAAFAGLPTGPVPPFRAAPAPPPEPRTVNGTSPGRQARIVLGGIGPGQDNPDRYPLLVMGALLGEAGRRLEDAIVDRAGLASSVSPFSLELTDVGVWGVSAAMRPANVDRVVELIRAELRRLRDEPPAPEELDDALANIRGNLLLNRERSVDLAEELSEGVVLGTYESDDAYLARIRAVSAEDVRRVAQAYIDPERHTLVVLRP